MTVRHAPRTSAVPGLITRNPQPGLAEAFTTFAAISRSTIALYILREDDGARRGGLSPCYPDMHKDMS